MAKFYGVIGFIETQETRPGVYEEEVVAERGYSGELIRSSKRWENADKLNDNINISNQFSILADPYAYNHVYSMRYIKYMNATWKITDVEIQYPRLTLSVGGLYNGDENSAS